MFRRLFSSAARPIRVTTRHCLQDAPEFSDLGIVSGSVVKSRNILINIFNDLKGVELPQVIDLVNENRAIAMEKMKNQAREIGGDAVVNVRHQVNSLGSGVSEIFVSGTAIQFKRSWNVSSSNRN